MIAGGASLAPRRWSWPASAMLARSRSAWTLTARMTATRNARNCAFACGSLPGSRRFSPSSVAIDQLLCLPEPLMPANGFSWMRNIRPWRGARRRIIDITTMLWSEPTEVGSKTGAISNWPGATSLCRVLAGMPRRHSSRSRSIMNARIRSRIGPKYWSSSSWPLGGAAPNSVRPVRTRSGRCSASRRSTRKYSCSGPMLVKTRVRRGVAEPAQHAQGLLAERRLRPQERDLVVERLAGERHERGRDRERDAVGLDLEEDRARHVPRGVAAGLEGRADAARRERARVGLALDEVLAGELGDRLTLAARAQERVVLLGGRAGHRHEPVRVVRGAVRHRPFLHAVRDRVDDGRVERLVAVDRAPQLAEDRLGEVLLLRILAEHVLAVDRLAGVLQVGLVGCDPVVGDRGDGLVSGAHGSPVGRSRAPGRAAGSRCGHGTSGSGCGSVQVAQRFVVSPGDGPPRGRRGAGRTRARRRHSGPSARRSRAGRRGSAASRRDGAAGRT